MTLRATLKDKQGLPLAHAICSGLSYLPDTGAWRWNPPIRGRMISLLGFKSAIKSIERALRRGDAVLDLYPDGPDDPVWPLGSKKAALFLANKSSWKTWARNIGGDMWHLVAVARTEKDTIPVFPGRGEAFADACVRVLKEERSVPILEDWAQPLEIALRNGAFLDKWHVGGDGHQGGDLTISDGELEQLVGELLASGAIEIPIDGTPAPDVDLNTLNHLDSYIKTFGPTLGRKVLDGTPARHTPGEPTVPLNLNRTPFPAQADAITGIVKTWEAGERVVWGIGEQGVGKTLIGIASAYARLGNKPGRILVHCPGHLAPKWKREFLQTVPGITVRVIRNWRDALTALPELLQKPKGQEVWILARDTAKLGWLYKPAAVPNKDPRRAPWSCPDCGQDLIRKFVDKKRPPTPFAKDAFNKRGALNSKCPECGAALWQADKGGVRRASPAKLWSKRLRRDTFDVLVADEIHEEKGDSAQGRAIGQLLRVAKDVLFLTGTLTGGKASDLFYHLARTQPDRMRAYGYEYGNPLPFVRTYGVTETITREDGSTMSRRMAEKPGIHPALYGDWLLGRAVFIELADLGANLPPYDEQILTVPMSPEQKRIVESVVDDLKRQVAASMRKGKRGGLGTYIQAAMAYPDWVFANQPVTASDGRVLSTPRDVWDPDQILPKEAKIIAQVMREVSQGRRCVIYATFTGKYDITQRLRSQLQDLSIKAVVMPASVPPEKREGWIANAVKQGAQVLICHPRLVATGLDLLEFPTLIWAQTDWSLLTFRQASRRSWRIGQTQPVKVIITAYEDTLQETCLQLLADKMLASEALEGRFSAEGLQSIGGEGNTALQLAQALVYGLDDLPDLGSVWRGAADAGDALPIAPVPPAVPVIDVPLPELPASQPPSVIEFAEYTARRRRRKRTVSGQLALFG